MIFQRKRHEDITPAELAAPHLAADEARWLAEDHGLSSYWETARVLSEALPKPIAESMEFCWAHADVMAQETEGDKGFYRRLMCHAAYLRDGYPAVYEALTLLVGQVREARACAADTEVLSHSRWAGGTASG